MTATPTIYNSNLLKGTGLVQETLRLLDNYQDGESVAEFAARVHSQDFIAKASELRVRVILEHAFFPRYVAPGPEHALALQYLLRQHLGAEALTQLFLVYTCRAVPFLADFLRLVYWPLVRQGARHLPTQTGHEFIGEAQRDGRIPKPWSASTAQKVSEHLTACLIDFRLLAKTRVPLPFAPLDSTVLYVLHSLHLRGLGDTTLLHQPEWEWLGLSTPTLLRHLDRLAGQGHFILQYSGELLQLSWRYHSLADVADALTDARDRA